MEILKASPSDIQDIIALAHETWNATYRSIISQEQIDFMLHSFYNQEVIGAQLKEPLHHFRVIRTVGNLVAYSHFLEKDNCIFLSKLYVLPSFQGRHLGHALLSEMEAFAKKQGYSLLKLNVNRANPAYHFYLKEGFTIAEIVDIPLNKYVLNDYVMEKSVS